MQVNQATLLKDSFGQPGEVARLDGNVLLFQHIGSSGCPGVIESVRRLSPHDVALKVWRNYGDCPADARLFLARVPLPDGVDARAPIRVHLPGPQGKEAIFNATQLNSR